MKRRQRHTPSSVTRTYQTQSHDSHNSNNNNNINSGRHVPNTLYRRAVESIVERDFFPGLRRLRLEHDLLVLHDRRANVANGNNDSGHNDSGNSELEVLDTEIERKREALAHLLEYEHTVSLAGSDNVTGNGGTPIIPTATTTSTADINSSTSSIRDNDVNSAASTSGPPTSHSNRTRLIAMVDSRSLSLNEFQGRYTSRRDREYTQLVRSTAVARRGGRSQARRAKQESTIHNGLFGPLRTSQRVQQGSRVDPHGRRGVSYRATRIANSGSDSLERYVLSALEMDNQRGSSTTATASSAITSVDGSNINTLVMDAFASPHSYSNGSTNNNDNHDSRSEVESTWTTDYESSGGSNASSYRTADEHTGMRFVAGEIAGSVRSGTTGSFHTGLASAPGSLHSTAGYNRFARTSLHGSGISGRASSVSGHSLRHAQGVRAQMRRQKMLQKAKK